MEAYGGEQDFFKFLFLVGVVPICRTLVIPSSPLFVFGIADELPRGGIFGCCNVSMGPCRSADLDKHSSTLLGPLLTASAAVAALTRSVRH